MVDSALEELAWLEIQPLLTSSLKSQIHALQRELRFLKMFLSCLATWNLPGKDFHSGFVLSNFESAFGKAGGVVYTAWLLGIQKGKLTDLEFVVSKLLDKVEHFKPKIKEICNFLFEGSLQCKSSTSYEILEAMGVILKNLKEIVSFKVYNVIAVNKQIEALEVKVSFFRNFVDFVAVRCIGYEKLVDVWNHVQDWANKAACLTFLYWIEEIDEEMSSRMDIMLSHLLLMFRPYTLELYIGALKASKPLGSDSLLMAEVVAEFVDFLLENLVFAKEECIHILGEGMIFLITFVMDPPEKYLEDRKLILAQTDALFSEASSLICSYCARDLKVDIAKKKHLHEFLEKINAFKAEVSELYVQIPDSSSLNFPRTNIQGFIDVLLGNLKEMLEGKPKSVRLAKYQTYIVHQELRLLRPFLNDSKLQNEHEKLKDLWTRIINMAYQLDHAIRSFSIIKRPIWYNVICLSKVIEDIKLLTTEVKNVVHELKNDIEVIGAKTNSNSMDVKADTLRLDEVVVGFKDEAEEIIDRLTRGSIHLSIISIVGMPGQGKTTLAKKVYNEPSVQFHFNKHAWSYVSQGYTRRKLILDILSDVYTSQVSNRDDEESVEGLSNKELVERLSDDELAELLYKCLKGQRYIIIMDDIWEIRSWDELKESFPDDNNGSRIVFTTRIQNVGLHAKLGCIVHPLRALSDEESWELLREKLFCKASCSRGFSEVGKQIARNCKGLPLSIVVVAGLLAGRDNDLDWWKQMAKTLGSQMVSEGCMDILELSYKQLPGFLKPCFLYFGTLPVNEVIRVQNLTSLWIAEGFVQKNEMKSLQDVAKEYLMDLISRSLVIVTKRSSNGGIKECRVHDLLHDLCLEKGKQENFFQFQHGFDLSHDPSDAIKYEQYRLCSQTVWSKFVYSKPANPYVHSLLFYSNIGRDARYPPAALLFSSLGCFLQVVHLEDVSFESFPKEITFLVHLRYLALQIRFAFLPSSICNLQQLETFLVKNSELVIDLRDTIWKMKRLRHVDVGRCLTFTSGDYESEESSQFHGILAFSSPFLSYRDAEHLLKRLPGVQKLECQFLESWDPHSKCNQFPILNFLKNLESLKVSYVGRALYPCSKFNLPSTLKKLTLSHFRLPWAEISVIGKLPNLEVLKLLYRACKGNRWDIEDEDFVNLKFLKLHDLDISEWNVSGDSFPCLQRLLVDMCYKLQEIPSCLADIATLKMIEIHSCSSKAESSARQILKEQQDMGNTDIEVHIKGRL